MHPAQRQNGSSFLLIRTSRLLRPYLEESTQSKVLNRSIASLRMHLGSLACTVDFATGRTLIITAILVMLEMLIIYHRTPMMMTKNWSASTEPSAIGNIPCIGKYRKCFALVVNSYNCFINILFCIIQLIIVRNENIFTLLAILYRIVFEGNIF